MPTLVLLFDFTAPVVRTVTTGFFRSHQGGCDRCGAGLWCRSCPLMSGIRAPNRPFRITPAIYIIPRFLVRWPTPKPSNFVPLAPPCWQSKGFFTNQTTQACKAFETARLGGHCATGSVRPSHMPPNPRVGFPNLPRALASVAANGREVAAPHCLTSHPP